MRIDRRIDLQYYIQYPADMEFSWLPLWGFNLRFVPIIRSRAIVRPPQQKPRIEHNAIRVAHV